MTSSAETDFQENSCVEFIRLLELNSVARFEILEKSCQQEICADTAAGQYLSVLTHRQSF